MARVFSSADSGELLEGMRLARTEIRAGRPIVIPTDTVYGIAADAFSPEAVAALLAAKGRGRQSPPPVLISGMETLGALAETVHPLVDELARTFWPGGLTIIVRATPSLQWDLGDTHGTVALRCPDNALARELLTEIGPMAVSSANKTGHPAATTAAEADAALGDDVAVIIDGGEAGGTASTIVDATALDKDAGAVRIVREGAVPRSALADILGDRLAGDET